MKISRNKQRLAKLVALRYSHSEKYWPFYIDVVEIIVGALAEPTPEMLSIFHKSYRKEHAEIYRSMFEVILK